MPRESVSFCFPAPRPTDWPSTASVLQTAGQWAKVRKMDTPTVCRLIPKDMLHAKEQTGRMPPPDDGAHITVLIEGWSFKE